MQQRAHIDGGANDVRAAGTGDALMSQLVYTAITTIGAGTLTASGILGGIINRTGPTADYIDTLPTVAQLIAAQPQLCIGDAFSFIIRNTVAFANTIAVGTGWTLGSNTAIAASLVREFLVKITATKPTIAFAATTTNASKIISALSDDAIKGLQPGMVLSGTGITAGTLIVAVNADNNTVTTDTNSTATGTIVALTANPTATIEGVRSSTL